MPLRDCDVQPQAPLSPRRLEWRENIIAVRLEGDLKASHTVTAEVLGPLAVHETITRTKPRPANVRRFTLSHMPSGRAICYSMHKNDIKRIAAVLARSYSTAFAAKDADSIRAKLPPTILAWLKQCYQHGGWVKLSQTQAEENSDG